MNKTFPVHKGQIIYGIAVTSQDEVRFTKIYDIVVGDVNEETKSFNIIVPLETKMTFDRDNFCYKSTRPQDIKQFYFFETKAEAEQEMEKLSDEYWNRCDNVAKTLEEQIKKGQLSNYTLSAIENSLEYSLHHADFMNVHNY